MVKKPLHSILHLSDRSIRRLGDSVRQGLSDYMTMLNERDGGIGGVKVIIEECETGYDTKKGVECYDSVKGKKPVVITPLSTGVTL